MITSTRNACQKCKFLSFTFYWQNRFFSRHYTMAKIIYYLTQIALKSVYFLFNSCGVETNNKLYFRLKKWASKNMCS